MSRLADYFVVVGYDYDKERMYFVILLVVFYPQGSFACWYAGRSPSVFGDLKHL